MNPDLSDQYIDDTFKSILHLINYSVGLTNVYQQVVDGDGTSCPLYLSTDGVKAGAIEFRDGETIMPVLGSVLPPSAGFVKVYVKNDKHIYTQDSDGLEIDLTDSASVADGDKGDVVVSAGGTVWTIDSAYTAAIVPITTKVVAGTGMSGGGALNGDITLNSTITQYTNEMAQDTVATMIQNGTGISWSYDDPTAQLTPTITLAPFDTDDLSEGATNYYYTEARFDNSLSTKDSDDLNEGSTNKYFTSARFTTAFATKTTSDLTEGSNLYYTDARFNTAFAGKTTDDLAEGALKYYTNERVDDRVAVLIQDGTGITWSYNDGAGTLTPTVTITQYTDELAQDAIGSALLDGTYIDLVYNDGTNKISADLSASGTPSSTTFLRGDNTWATPAGGGGGGLDSVQNNSQSGLVVLDDVNSTVTDLYFNNIADDGGIISITQADNESPIVIGVDGSKLSGVNTGDQDLSAYAKSADLATVATTGAYSDLSGTPSLGTIAAKATTDYVATADLTVTTGASISGSNTGDQDLSTYALKATKAIAGTGMTGGGTLNADFTFDCSITQYTDELAQDAVGGILTDTSTIDFTYDDAGGAIKADVKSGSITSSLVDSTVTTSSFKTISISGQSDVVADSAADTLTLVAGSNITLTTDATNDKITIAASGGGSTNSFETIKVSGQSDVVADSSTDTLTLVAGSNITITTNASTDTITIAGSGGGGGGITVAQAFAFQSVFRSYYG